VPDLARLSELVDDPLIPGDEIRRFYLELRGTITPLKIKVLNIVLLVFSQRLILKEYEGANLLDDTIFAMAQYQPNSLDTTFKCLFARFAEYGVRYSREKDFKFVGSFQGYWTETFRKAKMVRPDYSETPNASTFDPSWREKRADALANGTLDPDNNVRHFNMITIQEMNYCWLLRASKEVSNTDSQTVIRFLLSHIFLVALFSRRRFERMICSSELY
jgi:hypothetical protein